MRFATAWLARILWASFGLVLAFGALPHFIDGLTIDQALPVPSYMIAGRALLPSIYIHAANVLHGADRANGTSRIAGAEAALDSGAPGMTQVPELEAALTATPVSVRGWLLLARSRAANDRSGAATALSEALILAPYDYWVPATRAQLAADLWSNLDAESQAAAIGQVKLMWSELQLRPKLYALASSREGALLINRAYAGDRDDLIGLNRWISAMRRRSAADR